MRLGPLLAAALVRDTGGMRVLLYDSHHGTARGSVTVPALAVWGEAARPPLPARMAGGISLALWISVVAFGRWIGFTLH